jgi:hypothetical protein
MQIVKTDPCRSSERRYSRRGWCLSASRIIQTHQLVGAVFKYAANAGLATKNIAAEINRRHDLPETTEAEQRYLTHPQLLDLERRRPASRP